MNLFLEPGDVWLFRDGRRFDAGSDHRARSVFPPPPQVVAGALRSHCLALAGVLWSMPADPRERSAYADRHVKPLVGTADEPPEGFRLRGPVLARWEPVEGRRRVVRYYPLPADAYAPDGRCHYQSMTPRAPGGGLHTNQPDGLRLLWSPPSPAAGDGEAKWLAQDDLVAYLRGGHVATKSAVPGSGFFQEEDRLGIGLQRQTLTAEESLLYEVCFTRLRTDVGLAVEVTGLPTLGEWPQTGWMGLGGEARVALYRRLGEEEVAEWPPVPEGLERFRLYAVTAMCFRGGWRPLDWGEWFDGPPRLVAAAIRGPQVLGGYDVARGQHKPAYRYVPPGSVYYFEGLPALKPGVMGISDRGVRVGFGQFLIGGW